MTKTQAPLCPMRAWDDKSLQFSVVMKQRYRHCLYSQDQNQASPPCLVPLTTKVRPAKCGLFDHLVGCHEEAGWDRKAEHFRRLEVDSRPILSRRLHRKVDGFSAAQDTVNVRRRLLECI